MTTNQAVKHFGTKSKLAIALGIKPEAVCQWGEKPPKLRQFELEILTDGRLKRS